MRTLVIALACAGCFSGNAHECAGSDGTSLLCPAATTCVQIGTGAACGTEDTACSDQPDQAPCSIGVCYGQTCVPVVCGDDRVDPPEQCEPKLSACSADCLSNLTCGNGVVDPGEQCDDGNTYGHDGCDTLCQLEIPRWIELSAATPPPRVAAAMAYDTIFDHIVMFGGTPFEGSHTDLGDTWLHEHGAWRRAAPLSSPSARHGHAMAYDGIGRVYMFGGASGNQYLRELWWWDGITWHFEPQLSDNRPKAVVNAMMVYDAHRQKIVLFGGEYRTPDQKLALSNETWELDPHPDANGELVWTQITSNAIPPARQQMMAAYDAAHMTIVLFGGRGSTAIAPETNLADTFTYDGSWHAVTPKALPPPRRSGVMGFDGTNVVLTGGISVGLLLVDNGYLWDPTVPDWVPIPAAPDVPSGLPRASVALAFDQGLGIGLLVFGGEAEGAFTQSFVGRTIVTLDTTTSWRGGSGWNTIANDAPALGRAAGALDLDLGHAIAWGSLGIGTPDVVELADGSWSGRNPGAVDFRGKQRAAQYVPPPHFGAAGTYDEAHGEMVFFGGTVGIYDPDELVRTDTWKVTWIKHDGGPPARIDHAMAYDADRGVTVMFGGHLLGHDMTGYTTGAIVNETWEWNRETKTWTQPALGVAPPPRFGHAMAYDRKHHQIVVFGGRIDADHPTDETWLLDGNGWHRADHPANAPWPTARVGAALAWDPASQRIVMVGGRTETLEQDTWEWDGHAWKLLPILPPPPRCNALLVGASDGVVLSGGMTTYAENGATPFTDVWVLRYENAAHGSSCRDATVDDDGDGRFGCDDSDCWLACDRTCMPGDTCPAAREQCNDAARDCVALETKALCPLEICSPMAACGDGVCEGAVDCAGDCP